MNETRRTQVSSNIVLKDAIAKINMQETRIKTIENLDVDARLNDFSR